MQEIINTAIGGQNLGTVIEGRKRFPIRIRFEREYRDNIEELKNLFVPVRSGGMAAATATESMSDGGMQSSSAQTMQSGMGGAQVQRRTPQTKPSQSSLFEQSNDDVTFVPLSQLVDITITTGPPMISSENGQLRAIVYMNVRGRDMGSTMEDAKKAIADELNLPAGYSYTWSGQYEHKVRAQQTITFILPIVFLLIYLLLYLTFKDFTEAFVVMLSVPFALIGGVYMIYALEYNFSVAVWVGFIALYGIAVETGVVMVVYLHETLDKRLKEHKAGKRGPITVKDIYDATIEGAVLRLRPKLMTVITSMAGLLPVMWATGVGSDMMKPLIAPIIGGLFTSAIHVLIVTPVLFVILKERALKKGTLEVSKMADYMKEGE